MTIESRESFGRDRFRIADLITRGLLGGPVLLTFGRPKRSTQANALMWCLLTDISKTVLHCGQKYSKEDWKGIMTATFEGETRYAPALNGQGVIALGAQTRRYTKAKMNEFIEFLYSTGEELGAVWTPYTGRLWDEHGELVGGKAA